MNVEIDEYDIYHQDFTTASEWEVFIARIEEILIEWHLCKKMAFDVLSDTTQNWIKKSEEILLHGLPLTISFHQKQVTDLSCSDESMECKSLTAKLLNAVWESSKDLIDGIDQSPSPVSKWFGLNQYVMLCPQTPLIEESRIRSLMSSIHIASSNIECMVPIFLQIREPWQHCYLGMFEDSDLRTTFDVIHLKRIPSQCYHLSGLLNLFKGKISSPMPLEPVQMSAKFTYHFKDLEAFNWTKVPSSDEFQADSIDTCMKLPFGPIQNPIPAAQLNILWPKFYEDAVIDSASYSDFDPVMAPIWIANFRCDNDVPCLMSDIITKMIDLMNDYQLLMDVLGLSRSLGLVNPLHKITEAPITISKLVKAAINSQTPTDFKGPIPDEVLMPLLYYLFPDAVEEKDHDYPEPSVLESKQNECNEVKICGHIKTGPPDCLVWRLSIVASRLLDIGGLAYLAHLWYEFTQELQYRWEHRITVPGVAPGMPNARTCLLHQKLQLLNCCIEKARLVAGVNASSEDDEFYDCEEDEANEQSHRASEQPAGRLHKLAEAELKRGGPLYVPKTQDPAPKTEDQLEEDAELMLRLGEDARGSEMRAKMMSASLLSDMEAFKAANPGAELCDFVRWYSPRDWLPENGGSLGERMLLPSNPWTEAWALAKPVPAERQRRLFDETREAERVLHFLRSRTAAATAELLLPPLLKAAAVQAVKEGATGTGNGGAVCDKRRQFELAAAELYDAELACARRNRIKELIGDADPDKPLDASSRNFILAKAGGALPAAAIREFSLRVRDSVAPQVLRATVGYDIRIIGTFTERTVLL